MAPAMDDARPGKHEMDQADPEVVAWHLVGDAFCGGRNFSQDGLILLRHGVEVCRCHAGFPELREVPRHKVPEGQFVTPGDLGVT